MLKRKVDGREVELSAEDEIKVRAEWAANDAKQLIKELDEAKDKKIQMLRNQKIDELISVQIQAVNSAQNQAAIDAVTL